MQPLFNSFPHLPNQFQANGAPVPVPPQVLTTNPCVANSASVIQNSQMGVINPQIPFPFNNSSAHLGNVPGMQPLMAQPIGFMNAPNHLGMPQLGFAPQHGGMHNLNAVPFFSNAFQPQGQTFAHNLSNLPQQFNQNMGLPNGQFPLQNPVQNMSPLVPMQMPNYGVPNQVSQAIGPQNPAFFMNAQFVPAHQVIQNRPNLALPTVDGNASKPSPIATQQGSSVQSPQSQNLQQGNPVKYGQINNPNSNSNWRTFPGKNSTLNPKRVASQRGFQKSQFHHVDNAKRKFGFSNEHKGKGHGNDRAVKFGRTNPPKQAREKKRSLAFTYTEQEIQQWCEDRRKNYPSNANIEKKQSQKLAEVLDSEAKSRREQLKEILAKQAELGVEVAEIPSYYLSDSEKQVHGQEENRRQMTKRGRFKNKYDKRGRYNKKDQLARKQRFTSKDSSNISRINTRKPTLLQKLLSSDIRRDKSRLLQVFRFMVMNSFFKDWPEEPLKFPLVVVKDGGRESEVVEEKPPTTTENFDDDDDDNDKNNNDDDDYGNNDDDDHDHDNCEIDAQVKKNAYAVKGKCGIGPEIERSEEEGEIID